MHRPGIEPGSVPWQGTILPLNHRCIGFIASSAINFSSHDTRLAIFEIINLPSREKCQSVSLRGVSLTPLRTRGDGGQDALTHRLRINIFTALHQHFQGAPSRDGRSWHVWPPRVFDSSRADANCRDARRERRVPRLTPRLAPRLGAAASQPRLALRLALRLTPQLTPRTLNPKPNNPPCLE